MVTFLGPCSAFYCEKKIRHPPPFFPLITPVPVKIYYTTICRGGSAGSGTKHDAGDTSSDPSHEGEGGVLVTDRSLGPPPLHGYLIDLNEEIKK